jgi:hypothetical protein
MATSHTQQRIFNVETFRHYYLKSSIATLLGIIAGGILGYVHSGGNTFTIAFTAALSGMFTVALLSILEVSVSFDNAVLNATVLKKLSDQHRKWFLFWGILIAVVGMRLAFPVLIVSAVGSISPIAAFTLAVTNPSQYSVILTESNDYVSAFGGAFLLMVVLNFFLNREKENHWLGWLEAPLTKLAELKVIVALAVVSLTSFEVAPDRQHTFMLAGILGVGLHMLVDWVKNYLEEHHPEAAPGAALTFKAAIATLLYLEILDASMSFDGVVGAFAITTDIFQVMIGLGVGAYWVRSITIHLVEKDTMAEFRFLEHGALYAIACLAIIMFVKVNHHVPEVFTGMVSLVIIVIAVIHSHILNKNEAAAGTDESTLVQYAEQHPETT